jgi:uncharacterized membrane protein YedE/YeeE
MKKRNHLLSLAWGVVGAMTAFVLLCCLGGLSLTAILSHEPTPEEFDEIIGVAALLSLIVGFGCRQLFYKAKLPGYEPEE